ncbi:hypothetical protein ACHAXS_004270 [Conticribra weissflogii]
MNFHPSPDNPLAVAPLPTNARYVPLRPTSSSSDDDDDDDDDDNVHERHHHHDRGRHPKNNALASRGHPANDGPHPHRRHQPQPSQPQPSRPQQLRPQLQQAAAVNRRHEINQLPRSVRWRLSLGLLTVPLPDNSKKPPSPPPVGEEESHDEPPLLKAIESTNALRLRLQRSRYDDLEKKHYWSGTVLGIVDGGGNHHHHHHPPHPYDGETGGSAAVQPVPRGEDPLSSFLPYQANDEGKGGKLFGGKGKGVFGGKKRLLSRGNRDKSLHCHNGNGNSNSNNNHGLDSSLHGHGRWTDPSEIDIDAAACKGSRWADFYSTKEVLDIIEKDLNRLPSNHYKVYHEWRRKAQERRRFHEEQRPSNDDEERPSSHTQQSSFPQSLKRWNQTPTSALGTTAAYGVSSKSTVSGLSKWNFARRTSDVGTDASGGGEADALARGPSTPEEREERRRLEVEAENAEIGVSTRERAERLSRMLFVYAREHPELGYRQGMHEILSYVLLALEMDVAVQDRHRRKRQSKSVVDEALTRSLTGMRSPLLAEEDDETDKTTTTTTTTTTKENTMANPLRHSISGGTAGVDSSGNVVVVRLLDPDYMLHDAFSLFECIMTALAPSYDAIPSGDEVTETMLEIAKAERGESPMEAMTSSFISKIRYVARDEELYGHVLCMPVPPQLYFAKWVRLMFGREVAGGMKDVMRLWDAFFDLAAVTVSVDRQAQVSMGAALMNVLKTAAASMILLIRDKLLQPTMASDGTMTGEPDPNDGIGYLMNYPPMEDIRELVETISNLLVKERKLSKRPVASETTTSPPMAASSRNGDSEHDPSKYHKISNVIEHPLLGMTNDEADLGEFEPWPKSDDDDEDGNDNDNASSDSDDSNGSPPEWEKDLDAFRRKAARHAARFTKTQPPESSREDAEQNDTKDSAKRTTPRRSSLGFTDMASGLFGLGSKTVNAAPNSTEDNEVPRQLVDEHPLDNSTPSTIRSKVAKNSGHLLQMFRLAAKEEELVNYDPAPSPCIGGLEHHDTAHAKLKGEPKRHTTRRSSRRRRSLSDRDFDRKVSESSVDDLSASDYEDYDDDDDNNDDFSRSSSAVNGGHVEWFSTSGGSVSRDRHGISTPSERRKLANMIIVDSEPVREPAPDSTRKSPKDLAKKLEKSVRTLMSHFNEKIDEADSESGGLGDSHKSALSGSVIPDSIWEAMAEIDLVRKELLQQSAMESLSKSDRSLTLSHRSYDETCDFLDD